MSSTFFIPSVNIMGIDCLDDAMTAIRNYGFRKALIVTDAGMAKAGVASMIAEMSIISKFEQMTCNPHTFTSRSAFTSLVQRLMILPSLVLS